MFVYLTTNKINGKRYVGMTTRDDDNYLGSGMAIKSAISKHGKENFIREILETADDFESLCEKEIKWISYYNAVEDPSFYNMSYGGTSDPQAMKNYWASMTAEERKIARKWNGHFINLDQSGDKHFSKTDPNFREKVSKGVKNTWDSYTDEEKQARVDAHPGYDRSGSNNPMHGRSVVKERNLRWFNNGEKSIFVPDGTQPKGYSRGRHKKQRTNNGNV